MAAASEALLLAVDFAVRKRVPVALTAATTSLDAVDAAADMAEASVLREDWPSAVLSDTATGTTDTTRETTTTPTAATTMAIMTTVRPMSFQEARTAIPATVPSGTNPTIRLPARISGMTVPDTLANKDRENSGPERAAVFLPRQPFEDAVARGAELAPSGRLCAPAHAVLHADCAALGVNEDATYLL
jgi:hypothetical protein